MPLFAGFIGPTYEARSVVIDSEIARNIYPEQVKSASNAKQFTYLGTPGLTRLDTVIGQIGSRGAFSQDGRTWITIGAGLYELDSAGFPTLVGSMANDGQRVAYASNGRGGEQLAIRSADKLYIFDLLTNTLSAPIVLPLTNKPTWLAFIDGYFLLGEADTIRVWFCALEDGETWDALDFFARSQTSDNLVGGVVLRNRVWVFGSLTSEVYYDGGDTDNPFVPYPGSVMQEGLVGQYAVGVQGESVVWCAQDSEGRNRFVRATDYAPTVISTPAIAFMLGQSSRLDDVELDVYEGESHPFAIWTLPSWGDAGKSICWDASTELWHERSSRLVDLGVDAQWRVRGICSPNALICGDWTTGNIYRIDLDVFAEDDGMIRRVRRAPYISDSNQWFFLDQVELGMQVGVGLVSGQGSDPQLALNISRDGGHTWESAGFASIGPQGEYDVPGATWVMLGRSRLDRLVLEVVQTDAVRCVWGPGLYLRGSPGSGQR